MVENSEDLDELYLEVGAVPEVVPESGQALVPHSRSYFCAKGGVSSDSMQRVVEVVEESIGLLGNGRVQVLNNVVDIALSTMVEA